MKSASLPGLFNRYFWDTDVSRLNPQDRPYYVIQRLLEIGNDEAVRWLRKNFSEKQIKEVVCQSREITPKTANFWSLFLGISLKKIKCFQKDFQKTQRAIWPY